MMDTLTRGVLRWLAGTLLLLVGLLGLAVLLSWKQSLVTRNGLIWAGCLTAVLTAGMSFGVAVWRATRPPEYRPNWWLVTALTLAVGPLSAGLLWGVHNQGFFLAPWAPDQNLLDVFIAEVVWLVFWPVVMFGLAWWVSLGLRPAEPSPRRLLAGMGLAAAWIFGYMIVALAFAGPEISLVTERIYRRTWGEKQTIRLVQQTPLSQGSNLLVQVTEVKLGGQYRFLVTWISGMPVVRIRTP